MTERASSVLTRQGTDGQPATYLDTFPESPLDREPDKAQIRSERDGTYGVYMTRGKEECVSNNERVSRADVPDGPVSLSFGTGIRAFARPHHAPRCRCR